MRPRSKRKYLIAIEETRSIVALAAGILVFACALASLFVMVENHKGNYEHPLKYFTVWSNILSAVAAAFTIPYAVQGISKKRFILPRWIVLLQYAGANCLGITFVTVITLILPTQGVGAVSGNSFWLHIATPALTIVLFQCVETGIRFKRSESFLALIPYWVYLAVYFFSVKIIGEENGGWVDIYKVGEIFPLWMTALLMLTLGFAVSAALFAIHNRQAARSFKYVEKMRCEDPESVQLLVEAFGLGRYTGEKYAEGELAIPLDIFEAISKRYGVPLDALTKAYVKGALDAVGERKV